MPNQAADRRFRVHARHVDGHHARTLSERSFEAAAIAYLEDLHPPADEAEVSIIVHEIDTGHEHCFRIDLETGETASCG
jgi:hypothetical protein